MAEYKEAFGPEHQTLGVEGVYGIVPQQGAYTWKENELLSRFSRMLSVDENAAGLMRMSAALSVLTHDELELLEAAIDEVRHKRLRPLKELHALDKKVQDADKALSERGGFMAALAAKCKEYHVCLPTVTIEYRNLTVRTHAFVGSAGIPSVGNSFTSIMKRLLCVKENTVDHPILDNLSGVIRPGRPTLLLGPPGSGKSTLLKVFAGRYRHGKQLRITGDLLYNGHTQDEFVVPHTTALVDQHDNHIPTLSVMETLEFAHTCQLGLQGVPYDMPGEIRKAMQAAKAAGHLEAPSEMSDDDIIKLLSEMYGSGVRTLGAMRAMGISHTADTPVGDAMLRGVSGGERKRVTTAEMLVGPRRVMLLDEISTGLDSATLYSICDSLCDFCRGFGYTLLVSLLQPPPEVYFLFDELILMSGGQVTYQGPVAQALPFYQSLGFVCPPRKDAPSFLQEVATASGQKELAGPELLARRQAEMESNAASAGCYNWVLSPAQVVAAYWETEAGRSIKGLLDKPFNKADTHPAALINKKYALQSHHAVAVVARRQFLLVLRDKVLIKGRLIQVVVMGLITGSLFLQLNNTMTDSRTFFGVSFLAVMFMAMGAMPAIPVTMATKGVWYKHRAASFYPPWCHALGANLAQVPASLVDALVYSIIIYFMVGYHTSAARFFLFYLVMLSFSINCNVLFRTIAYFAPNPVAANSYGGFILLILILLSGFAIIRGSIPNYWIWAYYISPFAWALRCVVINEFTSPSWSGPGIAGNGTTLGVDALLTFDFYTTMPWYWGGIGYLWGSTFFYVMLSTLALTYLSGEPPIARVADPDQIAEARRKTQASRAAAAAAAAAATAAIEAGTASAEEVRVSMGAGKLPYTPITLVFQNLRYFVPNPAKGQKTDTGVDVPDRLELLKGLTGFAVPGSMTALMGGSGAGKTTLMDVIAGRKTVGEITGDIWINGHPKEQASWARCTGYVEQMDLHTPATTVKEALMFSARLRLPGDTSKAAVEAYVDNVIEMVELEDVMFSVVGIPGGGSGTGLNVDSRKRLTLAVELVANPSCVFMDEPTSGLDSRAAGIVMKAIRNVAADGRTVMVTIHQPSIEIFEAFDMLLLLQRGGRTTYFGPLGSHSKPLVAYLTGAVPGVEPLPDGYNPATWMLEVTGAAKAVRIKAVEGVEWPQVYTDGALAASNAARAEQLVQESRQAHPEPLAVSGKYAASLRTQITAMLIKFRLVYWRTPSYNFVRLAMTTIVALVYGSIYWGQGDIPNPAGLGNVQNVMGVLYSSSTFLGMMSMNSVQPLLGFERVVYYREQAAAMYSPWVYGIVLTMVETPYLLAQVLLFVGVIYPMIHFADSAAKFFYYFLMVFETLSFFLAFGSALVYITPSQQLAQVAGAGFNFLFNLFNGFVITYPLMPEYYKWANRLSPTTWVLYGFGADQLGGNDTPFVTPGLTEPTTVAGFLKAGFGYDYDFRFWCLLIVAAYIIAFRVLGILALRYVSFLRR